MTDDIEKRRPDAMFLRAPTGTNPAAALAAVFNEMFADDTAEPLPPHVEQFDHVLDVEAKELE